jgi:hypothetical protein
VVVESCYTRNSIDACIDKFAHGGNFLPTHRFRRLSRRCDDGQRRPVEDVSSEAGGGVRPSPLKKEDGSPPPEPHAIRPSRALGVSAEIG